MEEGGLHVRRSIGSATRNRIPKSGAKSCRRFSTGGAGREAKAYGGAGSWYLDNGLKGACGARKRSAYLLVNLVFYGLAKIVMLKCPVTK